VNNGLGRIAFGNGRFVALTGEGDVGISTNAVEWTYHPGLLWRNGDSQLELAFGNGLFLALASTGLVMRSSDGLTWQSNMVATNIYSAKLSFAHGVFLVSGSVLPVGSSSVFLSRFGTNWTRYVLPYLSGVALSTMKGRRLIVGEQQGRFIQSDLFPALGIRRGAELELSLDGAPGSYRIEASETPAGPWQFMTNVGAPWQGIQRSTAPQRFYRVAPP
jgi:hypothetical protein